MHPEGNFTPCASPAPSLKAFSSTHKLGQKHGLMLPAHRWQNANPPSEIHKYTGAENTSLMVFPTFGGNLQIFHQQEKYLNVSANLYRTNNSSSPNKQLKSENLQGVHVTRFLVGELQYKLACVQFDKRQSVDFDLIAPHFYQSESKNSLFSQRRKILFTSETLMFIDFFIYTILERLS